MKNRCIDCGIDITDDYGREGCEYCHRCESVKSRYFQDVDIELIKSYAVEKERMRIARILAKEIEDCSSLEDFIFYDVCEKLFLNDEQKTTLEKEFKYLR